MAINFNQMIRIARNLTNVKVGDWLVVTVTGAILRGNENVSINQTSHVAAPGLYIVSVISGKAPGDVGYYMSIADKLWLESLHDCGDYAAPSEEQLRLAGGVCDDHDSEIWDFPDGSVAAVGCSQMITSICQNN